MSGGTVGEDEAQAPGEAAQEGASWASAGEHVRWSDESEMSPWRLRVAVHTFGADVCEELMPFRGAMRGRPSAATVLALTPAEVIWLRDTLAAVAPVAPPQGAQEDRLREHIERAVEAIRDGDTITAEELLLDAIYSDTRPAPASSGSPPWNACPCGEWLDPPHEDGMFWDGDEIECPACHRRLVVHLEDPDRRGLFVDEPRQYTRAQLEAAIEEARAALHQYDEADSDEQEQIYVARAQDALHRVGAVTERAVTTAEAKTPPRVDVRIEVVAVPPGEGA